MKPDPIPFHPMPSRTLGDFEYMTEEDQHRVVACLAISSTEVDLCEAWNDQDQRARRELWWHFTHGYTARLAGVLMCTAVEATGPNDWWDEPKLPTDPRTEKALRKLITEEERRYLRGGRWSR